MDSSGEQATAPSESRVSRGTLQLMALILVATALLAIYSNVQKARRSQIEIVTVTPISSPASKPKAAPSPSSP